VDTCQDHTFAARIQDGIPSDSPRSENGKCLMAKKTETILILIVATLVKVILLLQGSRMGPQGTAKGTTMKNA